LVFKTRKGEGVMGGRVIQELAEEEAGGVGGVSSWGGREEEGEGEDEETDDEGWVAEWGAAGGDLTGRGADGETEVELKGGVGIELEAAAEGSWAKGTRVEVVEVEEGLGVMVSVTTGAAVAARGDATRGTEAGGETVTADGGGGGESSFLLPSRDEKIDEAVHVEDGSDISCVIVSGRLSTPESSLLSLSSSSSSSPGCRSPELPRNGKRSMRVVVLPHESRTWKGRLDTIRPSSSSSPSSPLPGEVLTLVDTPAEAGEERANIGICVTGVSVDFRISILVELLEALLALAFSVLVPFPAVLVSSSSSSSSLVDCCKYEEEEEEIFVSLSLVTALTLTVSAVPLPAVSLPVPAVPVPTVPVPVCLTLPTAVPVSLSSVDHLLVASSNIKSSRLVCLAYTGSCPQ
jgi:hypothetical protein